MDLTRRQVLRSSLAAAAAPRLWAQPGPRPARILLDTERSRATLDRRLFGSFLEHLGRAIYGGIYEPGSRLSDERGFRKDVLQEIKQLGVPIVRYPGGNFVSGYNWLDGVGPRDKRPRVLERAWNSIETNQFGTNEFIDWCRTVGAEPLLATNLGTGTPEAAAALVEYCNLERGTKWSDLRRQHGYEKPHNVRYWCLGNEMDGPWQIGHMTAVEYGRKATDAARQMRMVDRSLQLIACGSSNPGMSTFLEWDRQVLEECYGVVDAISLHCYYSNAEQSETKGEAQRYLALNLNMESQIDQVVAVCDYVRGRLKSPKKLWLSFDEWNVWYRARDGNGNRQEAPRLLEEQYNLEDALLVGGLLNSLMRRSDRVKIACLAQLVNVIAPIMTSPAGMYRQTIYYPYAWALAHARGNVLDIVVDSETYELSGRNTTVVPYVDAVATFDASSKSCCLFALNRDLAREREVTLHFRDVTPRRVAGFETLTGRNLKAANTFENPQAVTPQRLEAPAPGSTMRVKLPAQSYSLLRLSMA